MQDLLLTRPVLPGDHSPADRSGHMEWQRRNGARGQADADEPGRLGVVGAHLPQPPI